MALEELEKAVSEGKPYLGGKDNPPIDGDTLRSLFLVTDSRSGSNPNPSPRRVTPAGIIIQGSKGRPITLIAGKRRPGDNEDSIDLSYLAGRDGGPLPPLVLRNCIVSTKLLLAGSHFAFLSLEDCLITRIDADHCTIDNHCRLISLKPWGKRGQEVGQIRMVGARIQGTADFRGCRLVAPPRQKASKASRKYADRFALSLASSEIDGRLLLDHGFMAKGGVSLFQARIRNSVSLDTARLESLDHSVAALDAEETRLGGSLTWLNEAADPDLPAADQWHVAGKIILRRADIGGDVKLEHCRWADKGAFSLPMASGDGMRSGPGDAREFVDHISGGIDARAFDVAGQLRFGQGCRVGRWAAPPSRRADEDVGSGVFGPSFDGWKASIGKGVRIEGGKVPARFSGPIFLNDSNIGHGIIMLGDVDLPRINVATEKIPEAFDLSDARITGLIRLRCSLAGSAILRRAEVEGTIELQKLEFRRPLLAPGDRNKDCKTGTATILDLSSATISGALHLGGLSFESRASGEARTKRWTEVLQNLMHLGRLSSAAPGRRWIRRRPSLGLAHYGPGELGTEYVLRRGIRVGVVAANNGDEVLSGSAEPLRFAFSKAFPIATSATVKQFVALHFDQVVDDHGAKTIPKLSEPGACGQGWILSDCEFGFSDGWHKADIYVSDDYRIERRNERQTALADPVASTDDFRIGPFRFPRQMPDLPPDKGPIPEPLKAYFARYAVRHPVIDLRGLRCRTFDDNEAAVWQQLGRPNECRLLLDGIDFAQFDRTDPKERSAANADREPPIEEETDAASAASGAAADRARSEMERPDLAFADGNIRRRRTDMLHSFVVDRNVRHWFGIARLAADPEFSPQPFEVFARAYIRSGEHLTADEVIIAQKRLEWTNIFNGSWTGVRTRWASLARWSLIWALAFGVPISIFRPTWTQVVFPAGFQWSSERGLLALVALIWLSFYALVWSWPWILRTVGMLFDLAFRFGLKPARAVQTLTLFLLVGVAGANLFTDKIRPVPKHHPMQVTMATDEGTTREVANTQLPADVAVEGCNVVTGTVWDRAFYAIDVFIPLLDMRQECGFTIDEGAYWIRALKIIYAAFGWVVVSLTLLTITGVLRRDLEK